MNSELPASPLPVSVPMRPPAQPYQALLAEVWQRAWLTNNGPVVRQLEQALRACFGVSHFAATANGTLALHLMLRAWGLKPGEILTTPFSFVATASSMTWEGFTPIFADIDPHTWNMDPARVRPLINPRTRAILATHVFGNPCAIEELEAIAAEAGIPVFYDAAHAFGVSYRGRSLVSYGSASMISFHATKVFHTAEGGGVVVHDHELNERVRRLRTFGYDANGSIECIGTNAKMSELHAAIGLALLPEMEAALEWRRRLWEQYKRRLGNVEGIAFQKISPTTRHNAAYAACLFASEDHLLRVRAHLIANGVATRRYFHPALDALRIYRLASEQPVAAEISRRVLCLPLHHALKAAQVDQICDLVCSALSPQPVSVQ